MTCGRRSESGTALIEFALVLPILCVLAMGMLDFGRAFHMKALLDQSAREGARIAALTTPDADLVTTRVNDVLGSGGYTADAVAVIGPDPAHMVTVTVTSTFTFITPGVFALIGADAGGNIVMTGQCVMRSEGGS